MLAVSPALGAAGSMPLGQITAKGHAEINGIAAVSGATVFANDRIDTAAASTASLLLSNDRRLVLLEKSSFSIASDAARLTAMLTEGDIAVFSPAASPLIVDAGGTEIIPGKAGSLYAVELHGEHLRVAVQQGTASVEAVGRTVEVAQGHTLEATLEQDDQYHRLEGVGAIRSRLKAVVIIALVALSATTLIFAIRDLTTGCKVVSPGSGTCQVTH